MSLPIKTAPAPWPLPARVLLLPVCAAAAILLLLAHTATAQSSTGTVTGRVVWGSCLRAIPLPAAPDTLAPGGQPQTGQAQSQGQAQAPTPASGLPAGAVLVAVQSTSISARTDETGRFALQSVPAGQYLTVAAGPVASAVAAVAERPNVLVNGGQTVDLGTLSLGGSATGPTALACRVGPPLITPQGTPDTTSEPSPAPDAAASP
jgi:hypothetical protein